MQTMSKTWNELQWMAKDRAVWRSLVLRIATRSECVDGHLLEKKNTAGILRHSYNMSPLRQNVVANAPETVLRRHNIVKITKTLVTETIDETNS